jgi:hypothetical protein
LLVKLEVAEVAEWAVCVDSSERDLCNALGGGLASIGVSALRKSVYATGGVIGVLSPCSCLMTAERHADRGVSTISEGRVAVLGVWRGGRTGLVTAEGILSTTASESKTQPER